MIDYYLKFASEEEAKEVLFANDLLLEYTNDEVTYLSASPIASIDYVGIIFKPTGKILKDEEGLEYPEMKALDGYHVNVRITSLPNKTVIDADTGEYVEIPSTIPDDLAPYIVEPTSPSRVWA